MNNEQQYYTPETEDLRVGYKCEFQALDGTEWHKGTINRGRNSLADLNFWHHKGKIRTPYLTKDQIAAEGWSYTGKSAALQFRMYGDFEQVSWTAHEARLFYSTEDKWMHIYLDDAGDMQTLFKGVVKSVNELRTLMKWLGIAKSLTPEEWAEEVLSTPETKKALKDSFDKTILGSPEDYEE